MRILFVSLVVVVAFILSLASPFSVSAQTTKPWNEKCAVTAEGTKIATLQGIECVVENILSIATTAIGIASFVMLIVGSFMYLTSGGNPKATDAGQKTITFAIAGIVVALGAWIILNFIGVFTGTGEKITIFRIVQD